MNNIQKAFKAKSGLRLALGTGNVGAASQPAYLADDPAWNKQTGTNEAPTWWGMPSNTDLYKAGITDGTSAGASALQRKMDNPAMSALRPALGLSSMQPPDESMAVMQQRRRRPELPQLPGLRLALGAGSVDDAEDAHNAQLVEVGGTVKDKQGKKDKDTVPVVLAKDEAVLPAKTVAALGGPEAVESLIARTNGKPPAGGLRAGQGLIVGYNGNDEDAYTQANPLRKGLEAASDVLSTGYNAASDALAKAPSQLWDVVKAKDMPEGGYLPNTPPPPPLPEWARKMSPSYARAAHESPEAAQAYLTATGPQPSATQTKSYLPGDVPTGNEGLRRGLGEVNSRTEPARVEASNRVEQARVDNAPGFTGATVSGDTTSGMGGYSVQGRSNLDATRLQAPNGGGFITGQPDAQGLRKAAFIPGGQTPYTAADGMPTADWTKTSAYADGTARAAREKQQLAALVADKAATGDRNRAFSLAQGVPGLDSVAQAGLDRFSAMSGLNAAGKAAFIAKEQENQGVAGLRAAQTQLALAQAGQTGKLSPKDLFEMQRQAKNDAQAQANADRTHVTGRTDHAEKSIDDLLRQHATVGKDFDPQRYATLKKWEANFGANSPDRLNDPNKYAADMMRMLAEEQMIQDRGTGYLTSEREPDGRVTTLRKAAPSLTTIVRPQNWFGQVYEDTNGQGLRMTMPGNMTDKDREKFEYNRVVGEDGLTAAQRDQLKSKQTVAAR